MGIKNTKRYSNNASTVRTNSPSVINISNHPARSMSKRDEEISEWLNSIYKSYR